MNPARLILAVTVLAPVLLAQTGSISGVITNSITGGPVEGVTVHAGCLSGALARCQEGSAVTDNAGAFRLPELLAERYFMSVEKDGYSAGLTTGVAEVSTSKDAKFDVKLTPLAGLRGRVVDPDGKPVAGITVQPDFGRGATTDDQGVFILQKLSPGRNRLLAKVRSQLPGNDGERLVNTYYPSAVYAEQATLVKVEGVDLSGYEIRLRAAQARSIRGVLLDGKGTPMLHSSVTLARAVGPAPIPLILGVTRPGPSAAFTVWDRSETGPDGAFEFPAVLEGDWILKGNSLGPGNRQGGSTEVRVGRSDIDNATVRLTESFPIEVSPEWSDSQTQEPPHAFPQIIPLDGQLLAATGSDAEPPFTQHDQGLPGRYIVGPALPTPGSYVSAVILDGRNILWQAVELSGPTTMKLVFKKDGGTLRGSVEKGAGSTVVLMAEPAVYARFGLTARCDPDGNFSISDVPPGNYTAVAFQNNGVLYQSDLLVRIDSTQGKRLKIEAGATETVTLRVN